MPEQDNTSPPMLLAAWRSVVLHADAMRLLAVTVAAALVIAFQSLAPQLLAAWSNRIGDGLWAFSDRTAQERRVVIIDIDEKSTQALGPWPWPREQVARLLAALDDQGVSLKIVDILFDGPQTGDEHLRQALQQGAPSTVAQLFALKQGHTPIQTGEPWGALRSESGQSMCAQGLMSSQGHLAPAASLRSTVGEYPRTGHITPIVDVDGVVRRVPALICDRGQVYPSLVLSALSIALDEPVQWRVHSTPLGNQYAIVINNLHLPTNEKGQWLVPYQVPRSGFVAIPAVDVLNGRVPEGLLSGTWALLGSTAFGAGDSVVTPQGETVGGIEVHAQLLSAALDERMPVVPVWSGLWTVGASLLCAAVLLSMLKWGKWSAVTALPLAALVNLTWLLLAHTYALLSHHQMLEHAIPLLFVLVSSALVLLAELMRNRLERERLYSNLCSYLPEGAARQVALAAPNAQVQAQRKEATVMIVDLRNFSAYCEGRLPEETATVLHLFYITLERVIAQHGGVVEEMVGDSIMAVWNGSSSCTDHAHKAVTAAREVWTQGVAQLPRVASRKTPALDLGLGIETGQIVIGSFGPAHRRVHSVLGPAVTVASSLQELTADLAFPILVGSEAARQSMVTTLKDLGDFLLVGSQQSRKVYALPVSYPPQHLDMSFKADQQDDALNTSA